MNEDVAQDVQNRPQERRGGADEEWVPLGASEVVQWGITDCHRERVFDWPEASVRQTCARWNELQRGNGLSGDHTVVRRTVTTTAWEDA